MSAVLKVENLNVTLTYRKASKKLVEDVSFEVHPGECLGILGESGSGKSMTVKSILGLLDKNFQVSGSAVFDGHDLLKESKEELRRLRGSRITMVLQNPMTCFDPLYRIGNQMAETFAAHTAWNAQEIRTCCLKILDQMQILNGEEVLEKYPHQLSGGMSQRVMIAMALASSVLGSVLPGHCSRNFPLLMNQQLPLMPSLNTRSWKSLSALKRIKILPCFSSPMTWEPSPK